MVFQTGPQNCPSHSEHEESHYDSHALEPGQLSAIPRFRSLNPISASRKQVWEEEDSPLILTRFRSRDGGRKMSKMAGFDVRSCREGSHGVFQRHEKSMGNEAPSVEEKSRNRKSRLTRTTNCFAIVLSKSILSSYNKSENRLKRPGTYIKI